MQSRSWDRDKDYAILVKWWNQWEFGIVPKECLPPDGIIVENEGIPICAGGLYVCDGTAFGLMEWIVTDKQANSRKTHSALKLCIDDIAKGKGLSIEDLLTEMEEIVEKGTHTELIENQGRYFNLFTYQSRI